MKNNNRFLSALIGLMVSVPAITNIDVLTKPALASVYCQCVTYMKNVLRISGSTGNAHEWDTYLARNGWVESRPMQGSIVVMERNYRGADPVAGHVGFLRGIDTSGRPNVRGSNQGGNRSTEAGCNNVSNVTFGSSVVNNGAISFWTRDDGSRTIRPKGSNINLFRGQSFVSGNGYRFVFQNDQNVVFYHPNGTPLWATGTDNTGADRLSIQSDGNLVLYRGNTALWASNTSGRMGSSLVVQGDGNLVLYTPQNQPIWASNTSGGRSSGNFNAKARWGW